MYLKEGAMAKFRNALVIAVIMSVLLTVVALFAGPPDENGEGFGLFNEGTAETVFMVCAGVSVVLGLVLAFMSRREWTSGLVTRHFRERN
jgi:hypothetical protein